MPDVRHGVLLLVLFVSAMTVTPRVDAQPAAEIVNGVADMPVWNVGDRWTYRKRVGLADIELVREVIEATPAGYIVRRTEKGDVVRFGYYGPDLSVVAWVANGRVTWSVSPPLQWFQWPLREGMSWLNAGGTAAQT
jgi:hypothetical protein